MRLARIARSRHAPEVLAFSDVAARVKKLRVVEDVEELGAEFDAALFVPPTLLRTLRSKFCIPGPQQIAHRVYD